MSNTWDEIDAELGGAFPFDIERGLVACPWFTEGEHHHLDTKQDTLRLRPFNWIVICSCGASGPIRSTEDAAKVAWNTRHTDTPRFEIDDFVGADGERI